MTSTTLYIPGIMHCCSLPLSMFSLDQYQLLLERFHAPRVKRVFVVHLNCLPIFFLVKNCLPMLKLVVPLLEDADVGSSKKIFFSEYIVTDLLGILQMIDSGKS